MKKFLIIIVLGLTGCVSTNDNKSNNKKRLEKKNHDVRFKNGRYEMRKIFENEFLTDSVWYYTDKELNDLATNVTVVKLPKNYKVNQIINYTENNIDTSRSVFYQLEYSFKDSFTISFYSGFQDSVSLILGDLDDNYELLPGLKSDTIIGRPDQFHILKKPHYKRGKFTLYEYEDTSYKAMQLYIPERFLVK